MIDGDFIALVMEHKTSKFVAIITNLAMGFKTLLSFFRLGVNHKCGHKPLRYRFRFTFIVSFSPIIVLKIFFGKFFGMIISYTHATT
jgi:hypothetical protein